MNPKELMKKWIDAFNKADLYHDDAINH